MSTLSLTGCCFNLNYDFAFNGGETESVKPASTAPAETETAETVPEESNPLQEPYLEVVSKLKIPGQAIDVKAFGGYAYLTNDLGILFIIDISDKANPEITGKCQGINAANIVILQGKYAYISYTDWISAKTGQEDQLQEGQDSNSNNPDVYSICGFKIVDISDKKNPVVVGDYVSGTDSEKSVQGLFIDGDYAYLNATQYYDDSLESRLEIIDIKDRTKPSLTGYCNIEGQPNGIFVQGDFAYINNTYYDFTEKEYTDKSSFFAVDVSDRKNPFVAGACEVPANSWSVYARGNYAYLTSSIYDADIEDYKDSMLQIIDITIPDNLKNLGKCKIPGGAWEIDIKDDFLLVSNNEGGVSVINISDVNNPAITTSISTNGNSYDIAVDGNYGYIADGFNGILILSLQKKEPGQGTIVDGEQGDNHSPVAEIDIWGDELSEGTFKKSNPVYLSAADSYDPEGNDLYYFWEVNNIDITDENDEFVIGDYFDEIYLKSEINEKDDQLLCLFEKPGKYQVSLTVSDGELSGKKTVNIEIKEQEIVINPIRQHDFSVIIECLIVNNGSVPVKNLECYLRTPQTFYPYQTVKKITASLPVVNEVFDQSFNLLTHFELGSDKSLSKGEQLSVSLVNEVTMYEYDFKQIESMDIDYEPGDRDLKDYTGEDLFIDIDSPIITDAVIKAAGSEKDPVLKAKKIYNYITSKLYYDFPRANDREYEFMSASEILKTGKGVCADYAILYVAMLRAAGIPSRVAAGIPSALIMKEENQEIDIGHAWVELKLPGYGWIPVDITQEEGFMDTDFYMNLATEKGTSFLYESMTMDWSSYYYDGFKYKWDGAEPPDVEQKLIYKVRGISFEDLYSK
ncbi:MAG: hypothetical protein JW997_03200 [Actinobacteria bacterium]|nr:hypothetical protein [Actinomycetota bacterium]